MDFEELSKDYRNFGNSSRNLSNTLPYKMSNNAIHDNLSLKHMVSHKHRRNFLGFCF